MMVGFPDCAFNAAVEEVLAEVSGPIADVSVGRWLDMIDEQMDAAVDGVGPELAPREVRALLLRIGAIVLVGVQAIDGRVA